MSDEQGTPTPDAPTPEPDGKVLADQDKAALIATIAELRRERRDLRGRLTSFEKTADEGSAAIGALNQQIETLKADHASAAAAWGEERALFGAGLTSPEGQTIARALYASMPADGRPESIGAYLEGFKAEGAEVPAGLAPYLNGAGKQGAPEPKPRTPRGVIPPTGGDAKDALIKAAVAAQNWPEVARLTGTPWGTK